MLVTDDQIITVHTAAGVPVCQFLAEDYSTLTWTRTLRDASRAEIILPPESGVLDGPLIVPWLHWCSVWDGERDVLLWTGPVQSVRRNRGGVTVGCRDVAALLARQRVPVTRRWDGADPAWVARDLWEPMLDQQGVGVRPIVRPDPDGDRFDFATTADEQMMDETMRELTDLGLRWSVVSGIPVLGPLPREAVAVLGDDDFVGDGVTVVLDGTATYNDVLVRGPDNLGRARTEYYGLNLQNIVNLDSMFGVSNVRRAAQQYVRHAGSVRTLLELPPSTALHPSAPVHIDQLMPSARFSVVAGGTAQTMELTTVEVTRRAGISAVSVHMDTVGEDIELLDFIDRGRGGTA